ncbi:patatin-like phospholipase family protein [Ruminiclostridium herbifermentans]|uniref:Patatin-like phospholipase family protein n=1 Tax=Ruminiclostridium herbifermentans TaxID=2488810 RepID=A0A4V6EPC3_9FIRM|nr:patatin-like phospholipase family protein [Ruminiclostridium herbifermentans]QNU68244.1 patatin-like phospholipase family protein [Ruminiclostridium herbifermentans]
MSAANRALNIVFSGGEVNSVAFIGAYEELEKKYSILGNIAGVSTGALTAALIGAGYSAKELMKLINEFDFNSLKLREDKYLDISIADKIRNMTESKKFFNDNDIFTLLHKQDYPELQLIERDNQDFKGTRGNFLINLIAFSIKNAFLSGELFEEWVANLLASKGIYTFSDFRGGIADKVNPRGYKVRMTAVDANMGKVIVLPDDIAIYNIEPDKLEVARAVRMSMSIPFIFEPVTQMKKENNIIKPHYIIDGGVLDNFPVWLIDSTQLNTIIGLKLMGKCAKDFLKDENLLKKLLFVSHDTGVPKNSYNIDNIAHIITGNQPSLNFNKSEDELEFLYNLGRTSVQKLIYGMQKKNQVWRVF